MCGIIGIASPKAISDQESLVIGRDAMRHRGPDDAGAWWSSNRRVGLAHRRLSIVDLTQAGHQPMLLDNDDLCLTFNGEIYNFKDLRKELQEKGVVFRSLTDTEVLLAAYREWGLDFLARLNGMFALALYDQRNEILLLARDRAGEKPLFYALTDGTLRFTSELKGLMANPGFERRIDEEALDCYLAAGYVPGSRCILGGVQKLPPAHALTFDLKTSSIKSWRYWQIPEPCESAATEGDQTLLLERVEELLEDAVTRQLYADVPVGILLSGGVDSSLVTAMAVRSVPHVKTFTVRFSGHDKYDETEHARRVAQHFATEHLELEAEPDSVELLPMLARQFDEPMIDSSMIPTYLVSKLIRQHCTVALGGDGGDELFGGYSFYDRMLRMRDRVRCVPKFARAAVAGAASSLPLGFKGRNWMQELNVDLTTNLPLVTCYFDQTSRRHLLNRNGSWKAVAEPIQRARIPESADLLDRATRMDFENYLAEDILVKVDRASMLNSLEVRCPMLDYRLIEFAFSEIPSRLKASASQRKILLKKLGDKILPATFDKQRKQGFSIPLDEWLRGDRWRKFFMDVLLDPGQTAFNHELIRRTFARHDKGYANGERLFGLVLFALWQREYKVTI
jgi:asparagine synthase (glutamine-hydrolysing)